MYRARPTAVTLHLLLVAVGLSACGNDHTRSLDQELRNTLARAHVESLDPGPMPAPERVALGRALMFDKELSGNRDISCATCHHPLLLTGDALPVSIGTGGSGLGPTRSLGEERELIPRNAPEVFNRASPDWRSMFWDSRVSGDPESGFVSPAGDVLPEELGSVLEIQAMFPVTSADEMRGRPGDIDVFGQPNELGRLAADDFTGMWRALMDRLLAIDEYVDLFEAAFPDVPAGELGFQHAAIALAAFEADAWTLLDSPWDRYVAGDDAAIADTAKRGALLFYGEAGCGRCHSGALLTDQEHYNIGTPQVGPGKGSEAPEDFGRGRETGLSGDRYAFRTPPLRNTAATGPWMHAGAFTTLEAAVRHHLDPAASLRGYDASQLPSPFAETYTGESVDAILAGLDEQVATPKALSDQQIGLLLDFLESLTDPRVFDLGRVDVPERVPSGLPVSD